jgi:hypothetical protein
MFPLTESRAAAAGRILNVLVCQMESNTSHLNSLFLSVRLSVCPSVRPYFSSSRMRRSRLLLSLFTFIHWTSRLGIHSVEYLLLRIKWTTAEDNRRPPDRPMIPSWHVYSYPLTHLFIDSLTHFASYTYYLLLATTQMVGLIPQTAAPSFFGMVSVCVVCHQECKIPPCDEVQHLISLTLDYHLSIVF